MELDLLHFMIICPLVFLAGFVDAIAGGGGLISLPAYMLAGLPVHMAIATNKLSSSLGTATSCWRYATMGFVNWRLAPGCVIAAFVGSALGANLALLIEDGVFQKAMLAVLPLTALYVLRCQGLASDTDKPRYAFGATLALAVTVAFAMGVYDGMYGPGAGTFLILLLSGFAHLPLKEANGLTKVINLTTNLAALLVFVLNGQVIFLLGLVAGVFNIAGNLAGAACFVQSGAKVGRPLILLVIVMFFARTEWQLMPR